MFSKFLWIISITLCTPAYASSQSLEQLVRMAYTQNPMVKANEQEVASFEEAETGASTLSSPNIGVSELNRGSTTQYVTLAQKFEFPTKYGLRGDIEAQKRQAKAKELAQLKLETRAKVITLYYAIYSVNQIISLTEDDLQNVKDFSRIAETKYAAGKAAMHEAMKGHVLQTQIEADLISLRQEERALQARLRRELNQPGSFRLQIFPETLSAPSLKEVPVPQSHLVEQKQAELQSAKLEAELAAWDYAPDVTFRYQKRIAGEPEDSHTIGLEMSVPLWFWGKSAAQRAAGHRESAKRFQVEAAVQAVDTKAEELKTQAKSQQELLSITKSALIPQAQTSYAATFDAYKANKSNFLDLLDAERSLLKVRIAYYRLLTQYVGTITDLETTLGRPVSDLAI